MTSFKNPMASFLADLLNVARYVVALAIALTSCFAVGSIFEEG